MRGFKLAMAFLGLSLGIHFLTAAGWPNPSLASASGGAPVPVVVKDCDGFDVTGLCFNKPTKNCNEPYTDFIPGFGAGTTMDLEGLPVVKDGSCTIDVENCKLRNYTPSKGGCKKVIKATDPE